MTSAFDQSEGATSVESLRLDRPRTMPRIGQMMIARGLITHEQLDAALEHQRTSGRLMGEILVDMGAVDPVDLTRILAERRGYQFVDLRERAVDTTLMAMVPEDVARRYSALPLAHQDDHVVVVMAQPENVFALDDLRVLTELPVFPVMGEPAQIAAAIEACYGPPPAPDFSGAPAPEPQPVATANVEVAAPAPGPAPEMVAAPEQDDAIIRLASVLFEQAVRERASDVHIEALSDHLRVRFRVDGVLRHESDAPLSALQPLINRVRVLAGMDVGRTRVPREGSFSVHVEERDIDVRVAILPTGGHESCVLRLVDRERGINDVDSLGFGGDQRSRFLDALRKPRGLVVVSGPAGSGRTSTLYASMPVLNMPDRSVASVEDPIYYALDGVKQLQVDDLAGLTFPVATRLVLHSDPEAVFVDALADAETIAAVTDAAIAGRLVVATMHAPSAAAVPGRLVDMGVAPHLVASALTCVVGQRLVRRLCVHCAQDDGRSRPLLQKLGCADEVLDRATLKRPTGCASCRDTGYLGRRGVFEIMPMTEQLAQLVFDRAPASEIKRVAVSEGMESLRGAALQCALAGETSLEEVLRAIA